MKVSATLFALMAFCATTFAAPVGDAAAIAERDGEICCEGIGMFYSTGVDDAVKV